jgi:hypothetical protein
MHWLRVLTKVADRNGKQRLLMVVPSTTIPDRARSIRMITGDGMMPNRNARSMINLVHAKNPVIAARPESDGCWQVWWDVGPMR